VVKLKLASNDSRPASVAGLFVARSSTRTMVHPTLKFGCDEVSDEDVIILPQFVEGVSQ